MNVHINSIQRFIETNFLDKLNLDDFQFSDKSEYMLRIIYNHLLTAELEWTRRTSRTRSTDRPTLGNLDLVKMFSGSSYQHIPSEIRKDLESDTKIGFSSHLNMNERNIHIHIVFPQEHGLRPTFYRKQAEKMIYRIFLWLSIATQFACRKCSKKMTIFLYMTDHLKLLPTRGHSIDQINANTAFTTQCSHSTDIYIFREEEWFKVFIHETFHNLGLDFSTMSQSQVEPKILTLFPLNILDIRIFESYCETWAELMNIMFIAYWNTKNKNNVNIILNKMEDMMQLERVFSLYQCTKVLNNYQLKYTDIYQNASHKPNLGKLQLYKEETNAFAYYVLKPILFFNINQFIEWSIQNNGWTLDFKKTQTNIMKYAGLIEKLYDSSEYIAYMEKISSLYKDNGKFEYRTMRMTLFES